MENVFSRAQRWHNSDHGGNRSCYCCCELCDPDYGGARPNPFWDQVQQQWKAEAEKAARKDQ